MKWDPAQYLLFDKERSQPAIDLASRITIIPKNILDIGCGPGNSTAILAKLFPEAEVIGMDNSGDMIAKARQSHPELEFIEGDARSIDGRWDLLFSNACLQWVPSHDALLPYLFSHLNENGILAVQIPKNEEEPLFRIIDREAERYGVSEAGRSNRTLSANEYYSILSACTSSFDIWETKYFHRLQDHKSLVEWVKGTRLRPYLEMLGDRSGSFISDIAESAEELYPVHADGSVILGFRRLFFTAASIR